MGPILRVPSKIALFRQNKHVTHLRKDLYVSAPSVSDDGEISPTQKDKYKTRLTFNKAKASLWLNLYFVLAAPKSNETPGPIVEETAIFFIYAPLVPDGFAFDTASMKA